MVLQNILIKYQAHYDVKDKYFNNIKGSNTPFVVGLTALSYRISKTLNSKSPSLLHVTHPWNL